ncbi:disease resistance protein RPV1-like isoform X1 [Lactuca sativa]|nr:disease resistance protein RPV1-like isoform X1 [Lactuca sativa]XP_042754509.1 disease resistance protein RPV1-like isoform X1 [Lactuca sativa]
MKGCIKDFAIQVLESFGFHGRIGLRVLQQKFLITIYKDNYYGECLDMHDSIQEMGRHIVRHSHPDLPKNHSRLWKNDEIEHILANDSGTEETRCIEFYSTKLNPYMLIKGLGKMKALRYVSVVTTNHLRDAELDTFSPSFPDALQYLKWDSYPFRSLPKTFQANNLVRLEMPTSDIVQLWEGGEKKVLDKLRFLDLRGSKLKTIDLDLTPNLETLNLSDCRDLVELSDDIWKLEHLKSLELWACLSLKNLPEVFQRVGCLENLKLSPDSISMPKNLKYLRLAHCDEFEKLPEDIGRLECLEVLDLTNTKLKHLPDSINLLKHLNILILYHSRYFNKLPEDLSGLESLKDLDLSCTDIEHLPNSICELKHLESLNINRCSRLEKLPEDLGQLECLRLLDLSRTYIKHLPDSIVMLKNLHKLDLDQCFSLEKLPEDLGKLECLELPSLSGTKIRHLPDSICMLKHLKSLNLDCCRSLEKLPEELGRLECLED